MKVYKIEDLETFERDEFGRLICPSGDYSQIKSFGDKCSFGNWCRFSESCSFGSGCSFGKSCRFGERCSFGSECSFGKSCSFGNLCSFGNWCSFGSECSFGKSCRFGERCNLENNLKFENIEEQVDRVLKIDRIGSRKGCTYFYKTPSEIYVRCGCFFGDIESFEEQVNETHADNEQYRKEYLEAIKYAKAIL